jgi:hypothetical protein
VYLEVDLTLDPPQVSLREPTDLQSLKVVVRDSSGGLPALYAALEGVGHLDSRGNALLHTHALREMAGEVSKDPSWRRSFDRMLDHAARHGWLVANSSMLQAHCEWCEY